MTEVYWRRSTAISSRKSRVIVLAIIGIILSLAGICVGAVPYFFLRLWAVNLACEWLCKGSYGDYDVQINNTYAITAVIITLSIIIGFLPLIIYGIRRRGAEKHRKPAERI